VPDAEGEVAKWKLTSAAAIQGLHMHWNIIRSAATFE
jgi:hypothetical protein